MEDCARRSGLGTGARTVTADVDVEAAGGAVARMLAGGRMRLIEDAPADPCDDVDVVRSLGCGNDTGAGALTFIGLLIPIPTPTPIPARLGILLEGVGVLNINFCCCEPPC